MAFTARRTVRDGVPGTLYLEECRGGPGNYPYTKEHFVPDSLLGNVDTRNVSKEKPWESYGVN